MMEVNLEYMELDFQRALKGIFKRIWVIILAGIVCAALAFGAARYLITPLYKSSVKMYVNNSSFSLGNTNFSFSTSELSAAQSLVDTYIVILQTRSTLDTVIKQAELPYGYDTLLEMLDAKAVNGTEVFEITVTSASPQEAEKIANTIAKVFPNKVAAIVEGSSVRVVDYAIVPLKKASPNVTMYTAVGLMIGVVAACGVVVLLEMMDDQIHDEEFLNQTYDIPVLASIPNLKNSHSASYGQYGGYYGNKK